MTARPRIELLEGAHRLLHESVVHFVGYNARRQVRREPFDVFAFEIEHIDELRIGKSVCDKEAVGTKREPGDRPQRCGLISENPRNDRLGFAITPGKEHGTLNLRRQELLRRALGRVGPHEKKLVIAVADECGLVGGIRSHEGSAGIDDGRAKQRAIADVYVLTVAAAHDEWRTVLTGAGARAPGGLEQLSGTIEKVYLSAPAVGDDDSSVGQARAAARIPARRDFEDRRGTDAYEGRRSIG